MTTEPRRSRNTELGDRACFCIDCGWARRFMPGVIEPPGECPSCSGVVIAACQACGVDVLSIMAVTCDVCGEALRKTAVADGVQIRRSPRLPLVRADGPSPGASGGNIGGCAT